MPPVALRILQTIAQAIRIACRIALWTAAVYGVTFFVAHLHGPSAAQAAQGLAAKPILTAVAMAPIGAIALAGSTLAARAAHLLWTCAPAVAAFAFAGRRSLPFITPRATSTD